MRLLLTAVALLAVCQPAHAYLYSRYRQPFNPYLPNYVPYPQISVTGDQAVPPPTFPQAAFPQATFPIATFPQPAYLQPAYLQPAYLQPVFPQVAPVQPGFRPQFPR